MKLEIGKQIKATCKSVEGMGDVMYVIKIKGINSDGILGTYETFRGGVPGYCTGAAVGLFPWFKHEFEAYTPPKPTFAEQLGAVAAFLGYGESRGHKDFSPGGRHYEALKFHLRNLDVTNAYNQLTERNG